MLLAPASPAAAAGADMVRVLLFESARSLHVQAPDGRITRLEAGPAGLRADGRPAGALWRAEGGLLQVGDLRVRGALEVRASRAGLQVVNRLPLEDYVAGTLGREMFVHWHAEALRAQAVAARSYALHERGLRGAAAYDLRADTRSQVYGGFDAEVPEVRAAARDTRGQYLSFRGKPILAVYHASAGGRTASAEEVWGRRVPYLVSVPVDGEEDSPSAYWRAAVSRTTLGRALAPMGIRVGPIQEIRVATRSPSGRARRLAVRGEGGAGEVSARALRQALGANVIRSTLFEIRSQPDGFAFVGSGHGHGVGMSQWGAQAMARAGAGYREILAAFYPGTRLVTGDQP